jgi:hypothetical protein
VGCHGRIIYNVQTQEIMGYGKSANVDIAIA